MISACINILLFLKDISFQKWHIPAHKPDFYMKNKPHNKPSVKNTNPFEKFSLKKDGLILAGILIITLILFSPTFKYGFVNWDDDVNVTNNQNITKLDKQSIQAIFSESIIGGYNPLTTLSFAVEYKIWGLKPGVYHTNNVILHLVCTLLVYLLLRQLGMNYFIAALTALLFGIHPLRVESVAWVTERKDVLYSMFFLLSTIAYVAYRKTKNLLYYSLSLLIFIFSLLSKIQAVSLPLSLIAIDLLIDKRFNWKLLLNKIPFLILSAITGIVGIYFLQQQGSLETGTVLPFFQRIFIGSYSLLVYLVKAFVPYEMSAIYPAPDKLTIMHYLSMPIVLLSGYLIWKIKKLRIKIIAGTLFFLFNIMFMLQVVGAGQGYLADRFTYIPYLGLFFIAAFILNSLISGAFKTGVWAFVIIYMLILAGITIQRVKVWENSETLFTDVISKYPKVAVAHNNMGKYFRETNQYDKAIASYSKSLEIDPKGYVTYSNRGKALFDKGRVDEALSDFNNCLAINPDYVEALSNRGAALASKNRFKDALVDLDKAIKLDPANINAYSNRSLAYYYTNEFEKAINDITTYLKLSPDDADMINIRALCYAQLRRNDEALADYNRSIELKPSQGIFYQNRSFYYNLNGDKQRALNDILKAQELGVEVNTEYLKLLQGN
jgi:Flp pilus assembly protein TadD